MERKFLKDLGVADEAIDKIMAENGRDVEKVKGERDDYKSRLDTAQTTLKGFEGVDINDLKEQIKKLQGDLTTKEQEFQSKLDERDFNAALKTAAIGARARNEAAVTAVLGAEKIAALKASKNREQDIKAALDTLKADKENAYLFNVDTTPSRVVGPTAGPAKGAEDTKSKANEGLRSFFGKGE